MAHMDEKEIQIIRSLHLSHEEILELMKYEVQVEVDAYIRKLEDAHEDTWKSYMP